MRGVVALAAAISLPEVLASGKLFPHRSLIVFLTYSVIVVTLVLQGLTLPPLIRVLGLAGTSDPHAREEEARRVVLEAALKYLQQHRESDAPQWTALYDDLERHYRHRLANLDAETDVGSEIGREQYARYLSLSRELLKIERKATLKLLEEGRIDNELARELEHEFDLSEIRLDAAIHHQGKVS